MARIRSIKPEFPQSESIGRLSRDARLLFILLWTIADDSGITRGSSRMLASLLYPYDEDSPMLLDDWLAELEHEECIARYVIDGQTYLKILNWSKHQRIDKPTPSKFPQFDEASRIFANPPEQFAKPLGGIGLEGKGVEGKGKDVAKRASARTAPAAPADPLYHAIWQSFLAKAGKFTDYGKEGKATKRIIELAKRYAEDDPVSFSESVVTKFYELTQSGGAFWRGQPFTPSALSSSGIFDRVLAELKSSGDPNWTDHLEDYAAAAEGVEF